MLYTYIKQNYEFTDEDKKNCLRTFEIMLEITQKLKKNGILSLETDLDSYGNPFLRKAISLMIDGFDAEQINSILEKHMIFGDYTSKEVLERLLIKEGISLILYGHTTFSVYMNLSAFFGEDYIDETERVYENFINSTINKFYRQIRNGIKYFPNRTNLLESEIKSLSDADIQKILHHLEFDELVLTVNGSSAYVSERILTNISKKYADDILQIIAFDYNYKRYNDVEAVIHMQNKVLALCKHEKHAGVKK
ncbi:MAG: hypothetical protein FWD71_05505 [Oscillospiraceae bacterium]|nr:hypothetical protein [Oscillospiraceae bacterium]